ncbi:MAG: prolipoprotein diacylglyceryl transferase [Deltaproteobacteria bacterium]|nr:prolipoprotein diacylglyceryl transferase [Deltaproteobacteria bacterium]
MVPILVKFADFTLHTYGVLLAVGFLLAVLWAAREARREGVDPNLILDMAFYLLLAALVGSRVFYVLSNYHEFRDNPVAMVKFWQGGLVFFGGFLCAVVVGTWYVRKHRLNFQQMADILVPSIALGQAIGRLGCFAAGCCYGLPTNLPWAITFRNENSLAPLGIPLHPTQLYESGATFIIFIVLMAMRKSRRFQGKILWYYILFYSTIRFIIEFYRADPRGWFVPEVLSTSQAIAIPLVVLAVFMLWGNKSRH